MRASTILCVAIIVCSFALGAYLYPSMPERMASHWNAAGEVNGYMSRFWALFLVPFISIALFTLLFFLPRLDPLKQNIERFRSSYDWFVVLFLFFLLYIHVLTLLWNLGYRFSIGRMFAPAFGVLFYAIGVLLARAKRNWFIGIRTPWTLSSDKVWDETHRIGALLFKTAGGMALVGLFLPAAAIYFVLIPVVVAAIWTVVYSYVVYRRFQKTK